MSRLQARKKGVKRTMAIGPREPRTRAAVNDLEARIEIMQLLLPLGLQAVSEELQPSHSRACISMSTVRPVSEVSHPSH